MWELRDSKLSDLESFDNIGTSFGQKRNKKEKIWVVNLWDTAPWSNCENLPVIKNDIQGPWEDPHHWK